MDYPLKVNDLKFKYSSNWILDNINIDVEGKGITGIIGPNGSGKSTLIKNIAGVLNTDEGKIAIFDKFKDEYSPKDLAKIMGVVHQKIDIDYDFTVEEIVMMGRNPHVSRFHQESKKDFEIVEHALKMTDLVQLKEKSVLQISGGELQRTVIARALAQSPKLMLLDEPISHLDIGHQLEMMKMLKQLSEELEIAIVVVLHELNIAMNYCDNLILLEKGKIFSSGEPETVINSESLRKVYGVNGRVIKNEANSNYTIQYEY